MPFRRTALLLLFLPSGAGAVAADDAVVEKVDVDLRYRVESVAQDGFADDALASTLRGRFGILSTRWKGLHGYVGFEAIQAIGDDRYNSTANGRTQYPAVADPEDSEVDQAWLGWSADAVDLRLGRQRINLDNQRFVGAVGFRQNEQTFDGFAARWKSGGSTLQYAHLQNANRVFGEHHPVDASSDTDLDGHLLNYALAAGPVTGVAYAYLLDLENTPTRSHQDLGLRVAGEPPIGATAWKIPFTAEYAHQSAYADAPDTVEADYLLAELGVRAGTLLAKLGYEQLGGDGTYGFAAPLGTLHAFNGWADRFLATPTNGLRDRYAQASYALGSVDGVVAYHDFVSDAGSLDYGTEWNAAVGHRICPHSSARIEYADYRADAHSTDTRIVWFTLQAGF